MSEQTETKPPTINPAPSPTDNKTTLVDLMKMVLSDSKTTPEQKKMLIDELRKNNPGASDRWAYRWSVWILGGAIILTILCVSILAGFDAKPPEGLLAIGTGVVGALAGLLSPAQRSTSDNTTSQP